jgi:glycosyltransferase involved in cell wall biosynthesis
MVGEFLNKTVGAAVITKNHENYIDECIDSLLSQNLELDHIVISDDASEDQTFSRLQKYQKYDNISIRRNPSSLGPSTNSNKTLALVKTDFIIYTSGDDVSKPNRVRTQVGYLENTNYLCVVNDIEYLIQDSSMDGRSISTFHATESTGLDLFKELVWKQNFLNASCACFSKNINFDNLFAPKLLFLQDYDLWLRMSRQNSIISKSEKLLKYRISSTSLSQSVNNNSLKNEAMHLELFNILFHNLSKISLSDFCGIFGEFIKNYSKNFTNLGSSTYLNEFLIYFVIMSHNNTNLKNLVLLELKRQDLIQEFNRFLQENFRGTVRFI